MQPQMPQIPQLNQAGQPAQPVNPYDFVDQGPNKKKMWLMIGGGILVIIMLILVLTSGGGTPGQLEMKAVVQPTADTLGIIDEYEDKLQFAPSKSTVALTQILIRGNYQELNTLYTKQYKPSKRFSAQPKPDKESQATLDEAVKNNSIDSEIIDILKPKVANIRKAIKSAKLTIQDKKTRDALITAEKDMQAVTQVLEESRAF